MKYQKGDKLIKNTIKWIEGWYRQQSDGDWEHSFGVKMDIVDNPRWSVEINIEDTNLENMEFEEIEINRNEDYWLFCFVKNGIFTGTGGVGNLEEILKIKD